MTRTEVLRGVLGLGGVASAAFVGADGEILESVAGDANDLAKLEALVGYLASSRALAEILGAEAAVQTLLEFGGGAVVLTLLTDARMSLVTLTTADAAGRVRFRLRRLLPELAELASPAPSERE